MPDMKWNDESDFNPMRVRSAEILEKATDYFKNLRKESAEAVGDRNKIFNRNYDLYRKMSQRTKDAGSELHLSETFIQVETVLPRLLEAIIAFDPPFELVGDEDDRRIREANIGLTNDRWHKTDPEGWLGLAGKHYLMYGTCIVKMPYKLEFREKIVRSVEKDGEENVKVVAKKSIVSIKNKPEAEVVMPHDFYPVGIGSKIEELDGLFQRSQVNYKDLLLGEIRTVEVNGYPVDLGSYVSVDRILTGISPLKYASAPQKNLNVTGGDEDQLRRDQLEKKASGVEDNVFLQDLLKVDAWEYHGLVPKYLFTGTDPADTTNPDRHVMVEGIAVIAKAKIKEGEDAEEDGWVVIRLEENPYWTKKRPFFVAQLFPVDHSIYGIGLPETLADTNDAMDEILAAIMENTQFLLNQPTIEDRLAGIDDKAIIKPHARIKADDISGIRPLYGNFPNFINDGYKVLAFLRDTGERTTGATPTLQGSGIPGTTTATEADQVYRESNFRLRSIIRVFEHCIVREILKRIIEYNYQFLTKKERIRIVGKKGVGVIDFTPDMVRNNYDIRVKGVLDLQNKSIRVGFLNNFFALALKAPQIFDVKDLGKKIWEAMGFYDYEDIVLAQQDVSAEVLKIQAENEALLSGNPVAVNNSDIVPMHKMMHDQFFKQMDEAGEITEENVNIWEDHLENTNKQMQAMQVAGGLAAQNGPEANQAQPQSTNESMGLSTVPGGTLNEQATT